MPVMVKDAADGDALADADLLRIALAAARFPRTAGPGTRLELADLDRISHRFPGFLAARLSGFAPLAGSLPQGGPPGDPLRLEEALRLWAMRRFERTGAGPQALAARLGVPLGAGIVTAVALPAFAGLTRRDLPNLAMLDAPGKVGPPLSLLFRLFVFALWLRRPDMFDAAGMPIGVAIDAASTGALTDWAVVFGMAEHGLWHLLPPGDRRLLLGGTPTAPPLFLRCVMRFRPDLRALADQPLRLREWLRLGATREYGLRLEPPPVEPTRPGVLTVIGPWRHVLGIADDCFSTCRALDTLGQPYEVVGTEIGRWIETDPDKLALLGPRAAAVPHGDRALFCDTLFQATFWALANWARFRRFRRVDLFAPWELPGLPEGWRMAARLLFHTILSPSGFARNAFAAAGAARTLRVTSSVEVTPMAGRPAAAALALRRRGLTLPQSRPVLLCVFDFSSHMRRKNPEAALAAFARLRRQGVRHAILVLKTTRARRSRGAARRLDVLIRRAGPGVVWRDGAWPNADLEALIARADAYVSLHRAEGFGRNIAKALLLGTRVVATHWSGNAEMAAEPGYFGVKPARLPRITDRDYVLGEGQHWAEPDGREAVRQMRAALAPQVARPGRAALRFSRRRLARRLGRALEVGAASPAL
jgi:glycosyltransferase involved in cell wall biosynthesis